MAQDLTYFQAFYEQLHPALFNYARYILGSDDDAREVVNDVFLKLWERRDELGPFDLKAAERLKSYSFRATKNSCLNFLRAQKKSWLQIERDIEDMSTPLSGLEEKEDRQQLHNWLNELPPKCRQVFKMSRFDGLKNNEIAELLELSVKTVENQMTKALNFFRKKMNLP